MKPQISLQLIHKERGYWWKPLCLVALSAVLAMLVAGCGNKNGGGSPPPPVVVQPTNPYQYGVPSCSGCPSNMVFLDSALGETTYYGNLNMELALEFFGDPNAMQGYNSSGGGAWQNSNGYSGPYAASGRLYVRQNMQACGVPAGTYQVRSVTPGQWGYRYAFAGGEMQGSGPTNIRIALVEGYVQSSLPPARSQVDGRQFPYRIQARLQVMGPSAMMPCEDLTY